MLYSCRYKLKDKFINQTKVEKLLCRCGGVEMEKVRVFDLEMQEIYRKEFMDSEMVSIMFAVFGELVALIPFYGTEDHSGIPCLSVVLLLSYSVIFYLRPYLVVEGESIYQKLKFMPVTKQEIRATRIQLLNHRCKILFVIGLVLHQILPLCNGTFGIRSVLEIIIVYLAVWLAGIMQIYFTK